MQADMHFIMFYIGTVFLSRSGRFLLSLNIVKNAVLEHGRQTVYTKTAEHTDDVKSHAIVHTPGKQRSYSKRGAVRHARDRQQTMAPPTARFRRDSGVETFWADLTVFFCRRTKK